MTDVFISYSRNDTDVVRELVRCIESEGSSTFWDRDIPAGRNFPNILQKELEQARCVVVVWSNSSASSTWVRAEAQTGLDRGILVPVQIEACPLPVPFNSIQNIQLEDWPLANREPELDQLISSIQRLLHPDARQPTADVVRNDPTLSTRVAQRVVTQLGNRENVRIEKALGLERMLNRQLTRYFGGLLDVAGFLQSLVDGLRAELGCDGVWLLKEGEISCTGRGSSSNPDLLRRMAAHPTAHTPQNLGDYWIMKIGTPATDTALVLVGRESLDSVTQNRLAELSVILDRVE